MNANEKLEAIIAEMKKRIEKKEEEEKMGWVYARAEKVEYESLLDFIQLLPNFKVGDKIKRTYSDKVYDVLSVNDTYYTLSDGNVCEFRHQNKWELV